ncbi:hypothetical protein RhiirA1_402007 [Rhizophagus irregularis]|uniref:Uncharacterized protein n=1 Tax=Rhizophagus irregularis TaxID=588596 RepID=A0A2N0QZW7_9GLOM|nr:hypothetical protein RhiirA1_402007 [Rhizophagus irregularis]
MTGSQASVRFYCSICKRRTKGFKNSELTHLKKAIIKELQKRLKNHHNAIGEQSFSIHCSEDAFIGIFSFKGENAFDEIGEILNDKNWGERNYGQGQLSFVRLHVPEIDNSNISNKRKTKAKLSENGEMTITWKMMGGVDKENHKFEAGTAQFHFFLDQCQI